MTLSRQIQEDKLFFCTAKTGTPVYCPLPPFVIEELNAIPESTAYFFWRGLSTPRTAAGIWQESLKRPFVVAGIPKGHADCRFRDTFSVELLLAGVPIERVSILLGHQNERIKQKHYAPWVRARQGQLEADVRGTWEAPEPKRRVRGETRACNSFQIKTKGWCRRGESNPRPRDYETLALPLSYAGIR